jgi:N-acetylmuramoyl-L-alanine amidase
MRLINRIVIHCSASPDGVDISAEQIDAWHRDNGLKRTPAALAKAAQSSNPQNAKLGHLGYHWVVRTSGQLVKGRDIDEVGAHVKGHNEGSIGICMVGTDRFFWRQFEALHELLGTLAWTMQPRYTLPQPVKYRPKEQLLVRLLRDMNIDVCGHRDLSPDLDGDGVVEKHEWLKTCPGFDVKLWMQRSFIPPEASCLDNASMIASHLASDRLADVRRAA